MVDEYFRFKLQLSHFSGNEFPIQKLHWHSSLVQGSRNLDLWEEYSLDWEVGSNLKETKIRASFKNDFTLELSMIDGNHWIFLKFVSIKTAHTQPHIHTPLSANICNEPYNTWPHQAQCNHVVVGRILLKCVRLLCCFRYTMYSSRYRRMQY